MKNTLIALFVLLSGALTLAANGVPAHPYIKIETTEGSIVVELDRKQAPLTVAHILELVDSGYYDGTIFHRVIPGFMAQAGAHTPDLKRKETEAAIPNESGNGLSNARGTIAMARTSDSHSANSPFFINVPDNDRPHSHTSSAAVPVGYTVFVQVIAGMDVVYNVVAVQNGPL